MSTSPIAHHRRSDNAEQSLADHLRGVSVVTGENASKIGLRRAGELIGLLHDLGKYSVAFQNYLKSATGLLDPDGDDYVDAKALKGKVDHSSAGSQYVWRRLSAAAGFGPFTGQLLALCIASHHSGLIDCLSGDGNSFGEDLFTRRMNKSDRETHLGEAEVSADPDLVSYANSLLDDRGLLADVEALARTVVESNNKSSICSNHQFGLIVRFLFSCLIDADRTDTADFEHAGAGAFRQHGSYMNWPVLANRLEDHLRGWQPKYSIDLLRSEISQHCLAQAVRGKGTYTLTVPTGGGKTLASLRFALRHARMRNLDRIVYVVPFTSIIDQNAETVRKILEGEGEEQGSIVLEHHSNIAPERQTWREKILSENWDAPVVFTTMVQFLESLFGSGTRGARRLHQLANSVLIFDEAQSVPIKCVHLFNNAINFLVEQGNSTVVLCTATQPLLETVERSKGAIRLSPQHELMQTRDHFFDQLRRVEVKDNRKAGGWSYQEVTNLAVRLVSQDGNCLVIVNTKDAARKVFQLCGELGSPATVHLSTDMCPAHRKARLAYARGRLDDGLPLLCISTQLIEAGVDIDFKAVIRFMAGIDSIAQAAGRCNRNGRPTPGNVYIINPSVENLGRLPDIAKARDVGNRVLDDFRDHPGEYEHNLFGPKAIQEYYRYYFYERRDEMTYPVSLDHGGDTLVNMLSENSQAVAEHRRKQRGTAPPLSQSFMTAAKAFKSIDSPTEGVIVQFGDEGRSLVAELCAAFDVERQFRLLRRAQQFTVGVLPYVMQKLKAANALFPIREDVDIFFVDERFYSDDYGLATEAVTEMRNLYAQ